MWKIKPDADAACTATYTRNPASPLTGFRSKISAMWPRERQPLTKFRSNGEIRSANSGHPPLQDSIAHENPVVFTDTCLKRSADSGHVCRYSPACSRDSGAKVIQYHLGGLRCTALTGFRYKPLTRFRSKDPLRNGWQHHIVARRSP